MLLLLFFSLTQAQRVSFQFVNDCSQPIWPAIGANEGMAWSEDPLPPGYVLEPGGTFQTSIPVPWAGRIWGDCGTATCWRSSASLATLFELSASAKTIWYDISLVDGFTLGMKIMPFDPECPPLACDVPAYLGLNASMSTVCPVSNLLWREKNNLNFSNIAGCYSDCKLRGGDRYCCPPGENGREVCQGASPWFKSVCPNAYSFSSDDAAAMRTCDTTGMSVIFTCPP